MFTATHNPISQEQKDMAIELEFQYSADGRWFKTSITCEQYLDILHKGELDEKPVSAIKVFSVGVGEDELPVAYIYDFVNEAQGLNPWRLG